MTTRRCRRLVRGPQRGLGRRAAGADQAGERNIVGAALRWQDESALEGLAVVPFHAPGAKRYRIVGCVSGRRAATARQIVAIGTIAYVGNHGGELLRPGATRPEVDAPSKMFHCD